MKKTFIILTIVFSTLYTYVPTASYAGDLSRMEVAKSIMQNVKQVANVSEDNGMLVVEFHEYLFPYDINKRYKYIKAVADADAVIGGRATAFVMGEQRGAGRNGTRGRGPSAR